VNEIVDRVIGRNRFIHHS